MVTVSRIPPAQAEALYDATLNKNWNPAEQSAEALDTQWPGEDWDDENGLISPARPQRLSSARTPTARA